MLIYTKNYNQKNIRDKFILYSIFYKICKNLLTLYKHSLFFEPNE